MHYEQLEDKNKVFISNYFKIWGFDQIPSSMYHFYLRYGKRKTCNIKKIALFPRKPLMKINVYVLTILNNCSSHSLWLPCLVDRAMLTGELIYFWVNLNILSCHFSHQNFRTVYRQVKSFVLMNNFISAFSIDRVILKGKPQYEESIVKLLGLV